MSSNKEIFSYKGYTGSINTSIEDGCLYGKLLFIKDSILYDAETVPELKKAFELAVDDYLEFCEEEGYEPETPYKGSLNVRLGSELHRTVAIEAYKSNVSINKFIALVLEQNINNISNNEIANKVDKMHEKFDIVYPLDNFTYKKLISDTEEQGDSHEQII